MIRFQAFFIFFVQHIRHCSAEGDLITGGQWRKSGVFVGKPFDMFDDEDVEVLRFSTPHHERIAHEMNEFIAWFNEKNEDMLIKTGIAMFRYL